MSVFSDGEDVHPFRANAEIDCFVGECPGPMRLNMFRPDGTLLQRPYNDGPFYRCTRAGCHFHDHPRGVHEINTDLTYIRHKAVEADG